MIEEYDFRSESENQSDKAYEIALRPKDFKIFGTRSSSQKSKNFCISCQDEKNLDLSSCMGHQVLGKQL